MRKRKERERGEQTDRKRKRERDGRQAGPFQKGIGGCLVAAAEGISYQNSKGKPVQCLNSNNVSDPHV